jgi:hypothetical protein
LWNVAKMFVSKFHSKWKKVLRSKVQPNLVDSSFALDRVLIPSPNNRCETNTIPCKIAFALMREGGSRGPLGDLSVNVVLGRSGYLLGPLCVVCLSCLLVCVVCCNVGQCNSLGRGPFHSLQVPGDRRVRNSWS